MKYKKIIVPLVIVTLLCSLALPSSAQQITLRDLVEPDDGQFYTYYIDDNGYEKTTSHSWWSDNSLVFTPSTGVETYGFKVLGLTGTDINPLWKVSPNDYIVFKSTNTIFRDVEGDQWNADDFRLTMTIGFYREDGIARQEVVYDAVPLLYGNTCEWDIYFEYQVPANYVEIYMIQFEITAPYNLPVDSDSFFVFQNYGKSAQGDMDLYIGTKEGAPIYNGPDTTVTDEYIDQERALIDGTEGARNAATNLLSGLTDVLSPNGVIGKGMLAATFIFNSLLAGFDLSGLLTFALTLGVLAFILGLALSIGGYFNSRGSRVKSSNVKSNKKG